MEAGGSYAEGDGCSGEDEDILRGRGRSAVVGVRIGNLAVAVGGVEGLTTVMVERCESSCC